MTIEERLKGMQADYKTLKEKVYSMEKYQDERMEIIFHHLELILNILQLNMRNKYKCMKCEGYGHIYISPISDCGQDNKCIECNGTGEIWS